MIAAQSRAIDEQGRSISRVLKYLGLCMAVAAIVLAIRSVVVSQPAYVGTDPVPGAHP